MPPAKIVGGPKCRLPKVSPCPTECREPLPAEYAEYTI
jgi:hypothetical protein